MPHPAQLTPDDSALLVIDVQEKLMAKIPNADELIRNIAFLIDAANLLDVPVAATEQYPKGLGATVAPLAERLPHRPEKTAFSCCAIPEVTEGFQNGARTKIVLAGIESHVCVLNTALDLLADDFRVYLAVDAIGCRYAVDHEFALRRLEQAGAVLTTAETIAFEWVNGAQHPQFKAISRLVQERMQKVAGG